jgi:hypothetical protein
LLPDLSCVEHQGEVANYVMRLPDVAADMTTKINLHHRAVTDRIGSIHG